MEPVRIKLIAAFLGVRSLWKFLALGFNNLNPKLIFSDEGVEYRSLFLTRHTRYSDVEEVDVLFAPGTTNIYFTKRDSMLTFAGNTNDKKELHKCVTLFRERGCRLTKKAEEFYQKYKETTV